MIAENPNQKQTYNPIAVFRPYSWQIAFWRDLSLIILATGGAGGGKSMVCAEKMHALLLKYHGATGLAVRKIRESMTNSTILFFENTIIGDDPRVKHNVQKHRFEYSNGSMLIYGGMKDAKQREQIRSIGKSGTVDFVWMEEANQFEEDDFNEILARLRGKAAPFRQIMMSTNPDSEYHWINQRIIIGRQGKVYESTAADNPANPDSYLDTLENLPGVWKERMRYGRWVSAEGVIFDEFRRSTHVIETSDLLPTMQHYKCTYGGADSNYPKPRAGLIAGYTGNGELHIIAEFYKEKAHSKELGQWYDDFCVKNHIRVEVFHDPSAQDAKDQINSFPNVLCVNALNDVEFGIAEVNTFFKNNRIFIHHRCENLIKQLQSYIWKDPDKMIPKKEEDHLCDALRYLVASLPKDSEKKVIGKFIGSKKKFR